MVIAGANSYIGRNLIKELGEVAHVVALSNTDSNYQSISDHVRWRTCNLFSMVEVEDCLEEADYAIYFVQSLHSFNHLTQARSEDMNVIAAANFAQAAKNNSVKQLVYVSCPIEEKEKKTSQVKNLDEAETVIRSYGVPVTTVRIGFKDGNPLALKDVLQEIKESIGNKHVYNKSLDLCDLEESMTAETSVHKKHTVRSVQRLPLPDGKNAHWMAFYYMDWLSESLKPLIIVKREKDNNGQIYTNFLKKPLLSFTYSKERSRPDHALFSINGGILAKSKGRDQGTLEFRKIPGTEKCLAAIHDFKPSLPWFFYLMTQAKIHLLVMNRFKKKLEEFR